MGLVSERSLVSDESFRVDNQQSMRDLIGLGSLTHPAQAGRYCALL